MCVGYFSTTNHNRWHLIQMYSSATLFFNVSDVWDWEIDIVCLVGKREQMLTSPISFAHILWSGLLYMAFLFLLPPSANLTRRGSFEPCSCCELNIEMICSHFSFDSILRAKRAGWENAKKVGEKVSYLAKPTPLLCPFVSLRILVDMTCPYLVSNASRSFSL
jgi:hypothetical protein